MRTVEITYRYGEPDSPTRSRPLDTDAARHRLDEGSQAFAALLDGLADDSGTASRVIQIDPRDLGLEAGNNVGPRQRPFAAVLGAPMRASRSSRYSKKAQTTFSSRESHVTRSGIVVADEIPCYPQKDPCSVKYIPC
jgi:hypothetical protein